MKTAFFKHSVIAAVCASLALTPAAGAFAAGQPLPDLNLPSLGTVAGADLSLADERALGETLMRQVRADKTYLPDEEIADYLNRLGWRLVAAGRSQPFSFVFFPLRDASLNAFAMPGGFVSVHTGLIVAAKNESELAGVIGHEVGHVTQRHIARMIAGGKDSLAITLGSILLALLAAKAGGSSGGDAAMAIALGTQGALIQNQLKFSRDAEREADRIGFQTLVNAGFDPHGMENFFARLQKSNRYYENNATAFLSTHPLTNERLSDMENRTKGIKHAVYPSSLDFYLIQARCRVLQETGYDGWLKVSRYFRDALAKAKGKELAAAHYGLSIALSRMNKKAEALSEARLAAQSVRDDSIILDKNLAEMSYALAKTASEKDDALKLSRKTYERYPDSAMAAQSYAELLWQAGKNTEVLKFLRNQTALSHEDPDYFAMLARSYEATGQRSLAFAATGDMYALMGNARAAVYQFDKAQQANDGDFYTMSEIDAKLREQRRIVLDEEKDRQK